MYAINHATTALALKRAFPRTSLVLLLASVQIMEIVWVALNLLGLERVVTDPVVRDVSDIHLAHMPWSHSVLTMGLVGLGLGLIVARRTGRVRDGLAVGLGVVSHLILDLVTHAPDIALAPLAGASKVGLGLYSAAPMVAFGVELAWGLLCVALYGGGRGLYIAVVAFNLANLTMFTPDIVGLEGALAGHPGLIVALVGAQIALTLGVVWLLARPRERAGSVASAPATTPRRVGSA